MQIQRNTELSRIEKRNQIRCHTILKSFDNYSRMAYMNIVNMINWQIEFSDNEDIEMKCKKKKLDFDQAKSSQSQAQFGFSCNKKVSGGKNPTSFFLH